MKAEIISVGDELTVGMIVDTNSAYLSSKLAGIGIPVTRHTVVGDDLDAVVDAVGGATRRADLVLVNGGIGPTVDDVTRQAVATVAGTGMSLDAEWLEVIRGMFRRRGFTMPESNAVQAMIPSAATRITNPCGTAAGFFLKINSSEVAIFPGVPGELRAMFEQEYLPRLVQAAPTGRVIVTRSLKCFGMPESLINEKIRHLMGPGRNPLVGLLAKDAVISVKITADADAEAAALLMIGDIKRQVRGILGDETATPPGPIFGEDDDGLQHAIARLLTDRRLKIATAESCTGGLIAKRLTDVSGSSNYFMGGVVSYSNEAKSIFMGVPESLFAEVGAVSPEVARAMAEGIRARLHTDLGLSVTGIAGPTGGTPKKPVGLVYVALAHSSGTELHELRLTGTRDEIRDRSAKWAMNMVRTAVAGIKHDR